jgi:glucose-1-phosphate thymidylyltransferase
MPKQLIPVAGRPILEHVLDNIRQVGVDEVAIIVGDSGPAIADVIGDGSRFGLRVTYLRQDRPAGLAHCVRLARDFLGDEEFVMYLGDNMLPDGIQDVAADFRLRRPAAHVVLQKVVDPRAFGVAELDTTGRVQRLVEKPENPRSDLALIGVYFFTAAIHRAVAAVRPSARGELEITDAIQWLVSHDFEVRASEYAGYWKDAGRVEDVLDCNRRLLADLRGEVAGEVDPDSSLTGPVVIRPGARVVRSTIDGPAVIGEGTLVEDSHIGPGTAIGSRCVLRGTRLEDSIVLDDATITGVPGLHGSIVGRSAAVVPVGAGSHRLIVGDHTRVEIAG